MSFVTVDFETSYTKERDIRSLGVVPYLRHPETDIYLVSFAFPDGTTWAGDPNCAPWGRALEVGTWVSHNRSFDLAVYRELQRRGLPYPQPATWHCSADLMAYIQAPRALVNAAKFLLKTRVSKTTRDDMRGENYRTLPPSEQRKVQEYARSDALLCWMLWRNHQAEWPESERWVSRHTSDMGHYGIGFDEEAAEVGRRKLQEVAWRAESAIPWADSYPVTSPIQLREACRRAGIEPPKSTDAKSEEFDIWADKYAAKAPFVAAVQQYRRANRLLKVLQGMHIRNVDGRVRYNFKYFGATHTGRWSGDAGLNLQNLPRKAFEGVDVRSFLVPAPGHKFVVSDLSQIEARVALWLAEDGKTLSLLAGGMDLYEAHARASMGYVDPRPLKDVDPEMRQFAKCRVLGLGFGLGSKKFQRIVQQWTGIVINEYQAYTEVLDFRRKNSRIVNTWDYLGRMVCSPPKGTSEVILPSNRKIRYFDVSEISRRNWTGVVEMGTPPRHIWGGTIFENVVQATARDILAAKIREIEDEGLRVVLHVHDEVVTEVPSRMAEVAAEVQNRIMSQPPEWAVGFMKYELPMAADTHVMARYEKK